MVQDGGRWRGCGDDGYYDYDQRGTHRGWQASGSYGSKSASSGSKERDPHSSWYRSAKDKDAPAAAAKPSVVQDTGIELPEAIRGLEEAMEMDDWSLRCVATVLNNAVSERKHAEVALAMLTSWLVAATDGLAASKLAASPVPAAVVSAMSSLRDDPLAAALCCNVVVRTATACGEAVPVFVRAGVVEEVGALMDEHPAHGGVQNVCLLTLCDVLHDHASARQAVARGAVARVLRAMEATEGREVQLNALTALRILTEQGRAQRAGLQEAALRAKVAHQHDSAVVAAADELLALVTPRFKEVLCWHWQSGWCKLGPRCTYAHGPTEMRSA